MIGKLIIIVMLDYGVKKIIGEFTYFYSVDNEGRFPGEESEPSTIKTKKTL